MPDLSLDQLKQIASIKNYKPMKTKSTLYGNYIKYESKRDKDKNLSPKEYFDMIKPYLSDTINTVIIKLSQKLNLENGKFN